MNAAELAAEAGIWPARCGFHHPVSLCCQYDNRKGLAFDFSRYWKIWIKFL